MSKEALREFPGLLLAFVKNLGKAVLREMPYLLLLFLCLFMTGALLTDNEEEARVCVWVSVISGGLFVLSARWWWVKAGK